LIARCLSKYPYHLEKVSNFIYMNFQKFINFLPIIAIVALGWYSLQPKTSRETLLSVPANQSASIEIPNGEPGSDAAASLPEYEVVPGSIAFFTAMRYTWESKTI
jgi:hypothetical protein